MNLPIRQISSVTKRVIFGVVAAAMMIFMPAPYAFTQGVLADTPSASASDCSPVASAPTGINRPTGSDAGTYTYNSCTGLWENAYYTWSPATQQATPKVAYVYTCNTNTWKWTSQKWVYDPASNKFDQVNFSVADLPAGATVAAGSPAVCAPPPPPPASSTSSDAAANVANNNSASGTNNINGTTDNNLTLNNTNSVTLTNQIGSIALSGSANVLGNTTGGDAISGNATVTADILNSVQSSLAGGAPVATFVANIDGNVQGDLLIDPSLLQPASGDATLNTTNNIALNNESNNQINNNIDLSATSGNAKVADNTTGGNATSGNAAAVADVVNMLDSIIGAGQSFVGVININGNYTGNILVPQSFLDSLIASNAPSTTVDIPDSTINNTDVNNTNNQSINNNVTSTAASGTAAVKGNTSGGTATSGDASTKVTIFNLTGDQVVGANSLLVFVNVQGKWVGVIMDAPAGSTAAALGSNITENTVNNVDVNNTTNDQINNNINVAAKSGDATVADNTTGGNATSGNADTAVNLLNIDNSQFDLSGWFGVLFINVFGDWFGSFGVAPPPTANNSNSTTATPSSNSANQNKGGSNVRVFQFMPQTGANASAAASTTDQPFAGITAQLASKTTKVLGSSTDKIAKTPTPPTKETNHEAQFIAGTLVVLGLSTLVVEHLVSSRRTR